MFITTAAPPKRAPNPMAAAVWIGAAPADLLALLAFEDALDEALDAELAAELVTSANEELSDEAAAPVAVDSSEAKDERRELALSEMDDSLLDRELETDDKAEDKDDEAEDKEAVLVEDNVPVDVEVDVAVESKPVLVVRLVPVDVVVVS